MCVVFWISSLRLSLLMLRVEWYTFFAEHGASEAIWVSLLIRACMSHCSASLAIALGFVCQAYVFCQATVDGQNPALPIIRNIP